MEDVVIMPLIEEAMPYVDVVNIAPIVGLVIAIYTFISMYNLLNGFFNKYEGRL